MNRNLVKFVKSHQSKSKFIRLAVLSVNNYHNESSYYGYRPKPKREWKSKDYILSFSEQKLWNNKSNILPCIRYLNILKCANKLWGVKRLTTFARPQNLFYIKKVFTRNAL